MEGLEAALTAAIKVVAMNVTQVTDTVFTVAVEIVERLKVVTSLYVTVAINWR